MAPARDTEGPCLTEHQRWEAHKRATPRLRRLNHGGAAKIVLGSTMVWAGLFAGAAMFVTDAETAEGVRWTRLGLGASAGSLASGLTLLTWGIVDIGRLNKERRRYVANMRLSASADRSSGRVLFTFRF